MIMAKRALMLTGGIFHPFDTSAPALADVLRGVGIESQIEWNIEAAFARLDTEAFDLFVVHALRWGMEEHEKYAPHRAEWAYSMPPAHRAALERHVARGGGIVATHTAVICFGDWTGWGDLLGGAWRWGRSFHPPQGAARIAPVHGAAFMLRDEIYHHVDPDETCEIIACGAAAETPDVPMPVIWRRTHGPARIFVDLLGHDAESIADPHHAALIAEGARWCVGRAP